MLSRCLAVSRCSIVCEGVSRWNACRKNLKADETHHDMPEHIQADRLRVSRVCVGG